MSTRRRQQFVVGQTAWMLAALIGLVLLDSLSGELFFVLSLIGFLVVTELTAPFNVTPRWRRRLVWLIAVGLAVFGYIVIKRILEILAPCSLKEALGLRDGDCVTIAAGPAKKKPTKQGQSQPLERYQIGRAHV